jgi:hypothetical protein
VIVHDHVETPSAITPKSASTIAEMRTELVEADPIEGHCGPAGRRTARRRSGGNVAGRGLSPGSASQHVKVWRPVREPNLSLKNE